MLKKVVLFDMFNSSYNSRACKLDKFEVTLDFLNTLTRFGGRYGHMCNLYEFGTHYFINPSADKKHLKLVSKSVSKKKKTKILNRLQTEFAIFKHSKSFATISSSVSIISKLHPLVNKFQKQDLDRAMHKRFLKLHCWFQLKPKQICLRMNISRQKYNHLRQSLYKTGSNPLNQFQLDSIDPLRVFVFNAPIILKYMKRTSFRLKSLDRQRAFLVKKLDQFNSISPSLYKKFVIQFLGFKYRSFKRTYPYPDKPELKSARVKIAYALEHFQDRNCILLYFDSTTFADNSFKNFIWTLGSQKQTYINEKKIYGTVSLLMASTNQRIINYWIVSKVNQVTTASFLYETINHCRKVLNHQRIIIFMDNARIHLTQLVKLLASKLRVYFILNAPLSSKINQIEYVFELVKRNFRQMRHKIQGASLAKHVRNEIKDLENSDLVHQTRKFRKYILTSILTFNMWDRRL